MNSDRNHAFVVSEMIPPSKPPASEVGALAWIRANLFSSVLDGALTLLALAIVLPVAYLGLEWAVFHGVWDASSVDDCRRKIAAGYGDGARGACWAAIRTYIHVFLTGFYPPELYWRPILAAALLPVALGPVLFRQLPRKLLYFSVAYPVIAAILLFGGFGLETVHTYDPGGLLLTLITTVGGTLIALLFGVALAVGKSLLILPCRLLCRILTGFIRSQQILPLLFIALTLRNYLLPPGVWLDILPVFMFMIALPASVHMAEAIEAALKAIPGEQRAAARALGLNASKTFVLVVLPQAVRAAAPRIARASAGLLRDTSLGLGAGLFGPIMVASAIRADDGWRGAGFELFIAAGALFWVLGFAISSYARYLEQRLDSEAGQLGARAEHAKPKSALFDQSA